MSLPCVQSGLIVLWVPVRRTSISVQVEPTVTSLDWTTLDSVHRVTQDGSVLVKVSQYEIHVETFCENRVVIICFKIEVYMVLKRQYSDFNTNDNYVF